MRFIFARRRGWLALLPALIGASCSRCGGREGDGKTESTQRAATTPAPAAPREEARYLGELAQVHARHGMWDRAIEGYGQAIEKAPDDQRGGLRARLAETLARAGRRAEAIETYRKAVAEIRSTAEKSMALAALAGLLVENGNRGEAVDIYQQLFAAAPDRGQRGDARRALYALKALMGTLDSDVAALDKRLVADPADVDALAALAGIYSQVRRNPKKALDYYGKLIKASPNDREAFEHLATLQQDLNQIDSAVATLERMAGTFPEDAPQFYERIAQMRLVAGDRAAALAATKKLAAEVRGRSERELQLARLYVQLGDMSQAEAALARAIRGATAPWQRDQARFQLVDVHMTGGHKERAKAVLREIARQPAMPEARERARQQLQILDAGLGHGGAPPGGAEVPPPQTPRGTGVVQGEPPFPKTPPMVGTSGASPPPPPSEPHAPR